MKILFPADFNSAHVDLADYAKLFSHLEKKKFSVFFLSDLIRKTKTTYGEMEKLVVVKELETEAKKLDIEVKFIRNQPSTGSLFSQSCFADLVMINPITEETINSFTTTFSEEMLDSVSCPVFLSADLLNPYHEILIMVDFDTSVVAALKSFLLMFGDVSKNKKVTLLTLPPNNEEEICFEQDLVNFVRENFEDVGIVPMKGNNITQQLVVVASGMDKPLLIMGHSARNLFNHETMNEMAGHNVSLYFSN